MSNKPNDKQISKRSEKEKLQRVANFDINQYIPFNVMFTEMLMFRVGRPDKHVKAPVDVSQGECRVLTFVFLGKASSPTDLTENLSMDRSLVTRNINSLEKKGLITISKDPSDRRRRLLALTKMGNKVGVELVNLYSNFNDFLGDAVSNNEKRTLIKILNKLNNACHQYSG